MPNNDDGPVLRLRGEQFQRQLRARGLTTAAQQAKHLQLSKWTIGRLMSGEIVPGERIICRILAMFPDLEFEDFFEVIVPIDWPVPVAARKAS